MPGCSNPLMTQMDLPADDWERVADGVNLEPPVWTTKPEQGRYKRYVLSDSDDWDSDEHKWRKVEHRWDDDLYSGPRPKRRVQTDSNSDSEQRTAESFDNDRIDQGRHPTHETDGWETYTQPY